MLLCSFRGQNDQATTAPLAPPHAAQAFASSSLSRRMHAGLLAIRYFFLTIFEVVVLDGGYRFSVLLWPGESRADGEVQVLKFPYKVAREGSYGNFRGSNSQFHHRPWTVHMSNNRFLIGLGSVSQSQSLFLTASQHYSPSLLRFSFHQWPHVNFSHTVRCFRSQLISQ